ncbi:hypothetical protein [Janthinobacterium psychrotolerans]|uniref:Uncharacterized protein n=1 Tax=Janthinobacterium psychrotolerans TaxID=1747903 RepID=A0A1A7BZB7_9BURK|nr:hypothetical protein [Janthinobacterium psychrotolerans]OBV38842.1 hypothetical protein ASR47_1007158 [Janthinobacterium psychrotolerans]
MPTGANPKREREFKHLEKQFRQEGRYPGREEEVAARIVNKQRAQQGETRQTRAKADGDGELPIAGYQHLTVAQVREHLDGLTSAQLKQVRNYELAHKKRKGVLEALES